MCGLWVEGVESEPKRSMRLCERWESVPVVLLLLVVFEEDVVGPRRTCAFWRRVMLRGWSGVPETECTAHARS